MENKRLLRYLLILYVITATVYFIAYKQYDNIFEFNDVINIKNIIIFVVLSAFAESMIVVYKDLGISPGFAITLASILLFGPLWTMIIVSVGSSFKCYTKGNKKIHFFNTPIYKTLFNVSTLSISVFFGGLTNYLLGSYIDISSPLGVFLKLIIFVSIFLIFNAFIISILISIMSNSEIVKTYMYHLRIGFLNIVFVAPFGILFYYLFINFQYYSIILFILPVISLKYIIKLYTD